MDGCFHRVTEAVHRYEGTVNQFTGDGVMALFGAPIAHEDHAVRGIAAALAIQKSLAGYAADLRRERGLEFGLRVGLNTGPVVVGKIGDDLRMDYTAQGETVNLAARLQQAGQPGGVLVSEATHRLASRDFVTEDRGELTVKGIDRPVRAFAVTGARAQRTRFDSAVERGLSPLVGREGEFEFLADCCERVGAGRGQAVSLVGDAGSGKSRLAYELRRRLEGTSFGFLKADCLPHGEAAPFRIVVELLRSQFGLEEGETESAQIAKLASGVGRLDPRLAWAVPYCKLLFALPAPELETEGLDQAQRKRRTLEAIKALVFRAAEDRPQLLLVEDLQWIDRSSEEALRSLIDTLADRRMLVLCTYRSGYVPPWQERSFHQRLTLEPLAPAAAMRMVGALLPAPDARSLCDLVVDRAEGNPFFIEELAGYLRGRGEGAGGGVPETIHDLLTARIDRLREPLKRILQRASVLGREFPLRVLEAMTPEGEDARGGVSELVALELLHEKELFPELRLSFAQALIPDVAYQGLLLKSRAELHGQAGRALERLYADRTEDVLQDLARHFGQSGERAKSLEYVLRVGARAARLFAYEDAEARYGDALALIDAHAELAGERSTVLDRLGDVAFARGVIAVALEHWAAALACVSQSDDRPRIADLRRKCAAARWAAGQTELALGELDAGLAALDGAADNLEAARLYDELGRIHFRLGDNPRATEWAGKALALGERLGAPDVVSHAYNTLGVALARAGSSSAAPRPCRRAWRRRSRTICRRLRAEPTPTSR